jgi:adenosylcobinamide-GDP ribazoletransferase
MKAFIAALQFLTILPLPKVPVGDGKDLETSAPFFPVVGLLIGGLVALSDLLLVQFLPLHIATLLTVLLLVVITGGLHMDGLADTADGFFSVRSREKMLEIMRDSRIGTMGVLAIVFVVALKVAALLPLPTPGRQAIIILMPLAGRSAILLMMTALPYARPEGGLAGIFIVKRSWWAPVVALVFLLAAGWVLQRHLGLVAVIVSMASAGAMIRYTFKKIGGFTGDTLGAISEITEVAVALAGAAWFHGRMFL